jgi:2-polyprenyl-6-methoxyphenol hydroxylase-like FAD-dependent oxidoreductase
MEAEGFRPEAIRVCSGRTTLLRIPSGQGVESRQPAVLVLPQSTTERILADRLAELGHEVERPCEFVGCEPGADGVAVAVRAGDGSIRELRCEFLVGCDGAHSAVRHSLGLKFSGRTRPETFILCDAELSGPGMLPPEIHLFLSGSGPLPMLPIRERLWRIIGTRSSDAGTAPPTIEEIQECVDARGPGGLTCTSPVWLSAFRINERCVDRFRVGRVLLAGDAAHIHSPAGGQGMNTGLQDVANLGWKLAAILRGGAEMEPVLESYTLERAPAAAKVIAEASARTRLALLSSGPLSGLRALASAAVGRSPRLLERVARSLSGLQMACPMSALVDSDHGWLEDWRPHGFPPGHRMRDVVVEEDGVPVSLLDQVVGTPHLTLLLFSGRDPNYRDAEAIASLRSEIAGLSEWITTLAIWRGGHAPDSSWLLDSDGGAHRRFGATLPSACLLRPDGFVATRFQPVSMKPMAGFLRAFLRGQA